MFIVHVIPYTKGYVANPEDIKRSKTYRVSDDMLLSFLDNVISKKVYVSVRVAYPDDQNMSRWELID